MPSSRRRRSSISVLWQSASMFSPNSTNAPNVAMRETLPFTICPTLCCLNQSPQMSLPCLPPSDTQRDAPVAGLDVQHDHVHHVADLRHLRRVLNFFVPAHLRDMHQALDALFQLDEHSVVDDAYDFSLNLAARGIPFRRAYPGIRGQLLQSQ